jgi:hypothetical protein
MAIHDEIEECNGKLATGLVLNTDGDIPPFLRVPLEIREQIYGELLPDEWLIPAEKRPRPPDSELFPFVKYTGSYQPLREDCGLCYPEILRVSHQIHTEAIAVMYRGLVIQIKVSVPAFMQGIPPAYIKLLNRTFPGLPGHGLQELEDIVYLLRNVRKVYVTIWADESRCSDINRRLKESINRLVEALHTARIESVSIHGYFRSFPVFTGDPRRGLETISTLENRLETGLWLLRPFTCLTNLREAGAGLKQLVDILNSPSSGGMWMRTDSGALREQYQCE